jgi:hypothetical protein
MLRLRRIARRLACWAGWHKWSPFRVPDIGQLSGRLIQRSGRQCLRCWRREWQPFDGSGWQFIDLDAHRADIDRRNPAHPGG